MKPNYYACLRSTLLRLCLSSVLLPGVSGHSQVGTDGASRARFVASWATSEQAPEPKNNQPGLPSTELSDTTVRQIVHLSAGGDIVRLHLSNAFGRQAVVFDGVRIARADSADSSRIVSATDTAVQFAGSTVVSIPPGTEYVSDPVRFHAGPLTNIAISYHLATAPEMETVHPGAHAVSYLVHGAHTGDAELVNAERQEHWYQLASVDVLAGPAAKAAICFGDSITDGHASTTNGNDRWTDVLAGRLQQTPATAGVSVVNEGIGGNHLLTDGLGENALGRFDRDVLGPSGGSILIVFEGINDVGMLARGRNATPDEHQALVARIIAAYQQLIDRGHAHGFKVYGATMTPFVGSDYYKPTPANEADRIAVNRWVREPGHFDAIVDFDAVLRDPSHMDRLLPAADSGDHLHPGPTGYKMLGQAVPIEWFR